MATFRCFWLRASSRSGFSMFGRRGHARRREAVAKKYEERACASSPRHVLSCCYRCWDQDQISLVRALATDGFAVPPQAAAAVVLESRS